MSFDDCMARSWPGISDKKAFCAEMERGNLAKRDWSVGLEIRKINQEQHLATGWAAVVSDELGIPVVDSDGHVIPVIELEKAVHEAFANSGGAGKGGDMHETQGVCDVVESFVVTKRKREALGLGEGPEGWIVTLRINDPDVWDRVKSGELAELSLRGEGQAMGI